MEPLSQTSVLAIEDPTQVALARRTATEIARLVGMEEQRISAINVVVVELANNLLQHAGGGKMYIRYLEPIGALEIAAVDHGRGMPDVERCLQDGYSTASTPGLGLGAVRRFATSFAAYSVPGRTTVVAARMSQTADKPDFSVICKALDGETLSGDSWRVSPTGECILMVDGLGHGMYAADAAKVAVEVFDRHACISPTSMLDMMHGAMRSTRGAAAAVARISHETRTIEFAGVGNISCIILNSVKSQSLVSHNGTLGHQMRRNQLFTYGYQPGDLLMMQSDGLTTNSAKSIPPSLLLQPPSIVAPFVFSENIRGRDDATLLVYRLA